MVCVLSLRSSMVNRSAALMLLYTNNFLIELEASTSQIANRRISHQLLFVQNLEFLDYEPAVRREVLKITTPNSFARATCWRVRRRQHCRRPVAGWRHGSDCQRGGVAGWCRPKNRRSRQVCSTARKSASGGAVTQLHARGISP